MRFGTRAVAITLHTDSPATPEVSLRLNVHGSERPPLLLAAEGDLSYRDAKVGDCMQLVVTTVERLSETVPPNIETDLAFLKISRHKEELRPVVTQPDTPATDLIVHIVTYRVEIALPPPDAGFSGEIRVRDPWHSDHTMTVAARGEVTPDVQVIPRQVFVSKEEASNPSYSRRVLVRTKQPSEIRDLGIVSANSSCPFTRWMRMNRPDFGSSS
jgi:hypothetical protein